MAVSNIEKFDDIASRIFAELYQSFPIPRNLRTDDYLDNETRWDETYKQDVFVDSGEFFEATVNWLMAAGYFTGSFNHYSRVEDAVLTSKGLEVLRATPASLKGGPSIGEQLAGAAKAGGAETMRGLLSEALGIGARLVSPLVGLTP